MAAERERMAAERARLTALGREMVEKQRRLEHERLEADRPWEEWQADEAVRNDKRRAQDAAWEAQRSAWERERDEVHSSNSLTP